MAKRLMNLRDVPDAEADGVRAMLDELGLEWYEVPPTSFGLSAGSLWIRNDADYERAREAYEDFQAEYTRRSRNGEFFDHEAAQPIRLIVALVFSAAILGFFFWPVVQLLT